jgi:hypothetical protein
MPCLPFPRAFFSVSVVSARPFELCDVRLLLRESL